MKMCVCEVEMALLMFSCAGDRLLRRHVVIVRMRCRRQIYLISMRSMPM